jgi:chorismate mutase/prephenate dehydratase
MENKMIDIKEIRETIDGIDGEIIDLLAKRLEAAKVVGDYKRENNMAIFDALREEEVVKSAVARIPADMSAEATQLMRSLMALAREYMRDQLFKNEEELLPSPVQPKAENVRCVYQGAPGAWSEQAARKLFPNAEREAALFFDDVFAAVKKGSADYGVVPIENSQSGAIGETYDLLRRYGCYVVGRTWMDIKHCLIAKHGTKLTDIRKVYSHPQGFKQCHRFLLDKAWDHIAASNTAVAAESVRDSKETNVAAIGAPLAAELNGLDILADDITDQSKNRTSFVVIGNNPEYNEKSDLISITFSLMHRSGSLCEALMPFMASGLNLTRIESRPSLSPENYRFFAEFNGHIEDKLVQETLRHTAGATEYLEVLGCYNTID